MSYDSSRLVSVSIAVSETIGALVHTFLAPASGCLYDIQLSTTTTWAGATNKLLVEVGTDGDADLYGELDSGVAAAGTGMSARYTDSATVGIVDATNEFQAGDSVTITVTPPAGAGEAGAGLLTVVFQLNS
jgi:hypothetical protein